MLINPNGDVVVVADVDAGVVAEISLRELRETGRISGLKQPNTMFFSRDGKLLYVGNRGSAGISVIDTAAGKVIDTIRVRDDPETSAHEDGVLAVASTPYAWAGFALSENGRDLTVIDLRTRTRMKTLRLQGVADRPYGTQDGAFMIIPSSVDKTITLVSLESMTEVARLPGAADITDVRTGYLETLAFVVSRGESRVLVIDLVDRKRSAKSPFQADPRPPSRRRTEPSFTLRLARPTRSPSSISSIAGC